MSWQVLISKYHLRTLLVRNKKLPNIHRNFCRNIREFFYSISSFIFLPDDIQIAQLRVEYKKAAVLGDMIYPKLSKEADRIVVELCDEQENHMQFWNLKKKYKRRDRIEKLPDIPTEISVNIREFFVANK